MYCPKTGKVWVYTNPDKLDEIQVRFLWCYLRFRHLLQILPLIASPDFTRSLHFRFQVRYKPSFQPV